jgi:hypothetical protein
VLVGVGVGGVEDRLIEEGVGHRAVVGFRLVVFEKGMAISLANICVRVEKKLARRFKRTKGGFVGLEQPGAAPGRGARLRLCRVLAMHASCARAGSEAHSTGKNKTAEQPTMLGGTFRGRWVVRALNG